MHPLTYGALVAARQKDFRAAAEAARARRDSRIRRDR